MTLSSLNYEHRIDRVIVFAMTSLITTALNSFIYNVFKIAEAMFDCRFKFKPIFIQYFRYLIYWLAVQVHIVIMDF